MIYSFFFFFYKKIKCGPILGNNNNLRNDSFSRQRTRIKLYECQLIDIWKKYLRNRTFEELSLFPVPKILFLNAMWLLQLSINSSHTSPEVSCMNVTRMLRLQIAKSEGSLCRCLPDTKLKKKKKKMLHGWQARCRALHTEEEAYRRLEGGRIHYHNWNVGETKWNGGGNAYE